MPDPTDHTPDPARPRIGLALLSADWFYRRGGVDKPPASAQALHKRVLADVEGIVAALEPVADLVHPQLITTAAQGARAADDFKAADVDGIVICPVTWCEDEPLIRILENMRAVPTLLWCFCGLRGGAARPLDLVGLFHGSGPVGSLQSSGTIRKFGRDPTVVVGHHADKAVIDEVADFACAARVAGTLRDARIGVLPHRCGAMAGTWVDEFALMERIGPKLVPITVEQYGSVCDRIQTDRVGELLNWMVAKYKPRDISNRSLDRAARASLGLARVFDEFGLDALAIDDTNEPFLERIGLRPAMYVPEMCEAGRVVAMEADVPAAVAMLMITRLTGEPVMYTEIQNYDPAENRVLVSHAGMHDWRLARDLKEVRLVPDPEFVEVSALEGAFGQYRLRSGPVTLVNFVQGPAGFALTTTGGESLDGPIELAGFAHGAVRMHTPLAEFFKAAIRRGVTQHWLLSFAPALTRRLERLARIKGIDFSAI